MYVIIKTSKYCSLPGMNTLFWQMVGRHKFCIKGQPDFGEGCSDINGKYLVLEEESGTGVWVDDVAYIKSIMCLFDVEIIDFDSALFNYNRHICNS